MGQVIDSSLWVDYFRRRTPLAIKGRVAAFINDAEALLCNPIRFEILRAALSKERSLIEQTFATFPVLADPPDLWRQAARLGQQCIDSGCLAPAIDLLIAAICLEHHVQLITFDTHFVAIAKVSPLELVLLERSQVS